jgi:hypothetical protein
MVGIHIFIREKYANKVKDGLVGDTRMGAKRNRYIFVVGNLNERNACEFPGKDAKIKLESIFKKLEGKCVD